MMVVVIVVVAAVIVVVAAVITIVVVVVVVIVVVVVVVVVAAVVVVYLITLFQLPRLYSVELCKKGFIIYVVKLRACWIKQSTVNIKIAQMESVLDKNTMKFCKEPDINLHIY
jgi:hypothetical protein